MVLEICMVNSFLIYTKEFDRNISLKEFTLEIFKFLIAPSFEKDQQKRIENLNSLHYPVRGNSSKYCQVCKAHRSIYICELCSINSKKKRKIALCVTERDCFKKYHIENKI